jgi:hypothetical protein
VAGTEWARGESIGAKGREVTAGQTTKDFISLWKAAGKSVVNSEQKSNMVWHMF